MAPEVSLPLKPSVFALVSNVARLYECEPSAYAPFRLSAARELPSPEKKPMIARVDMPAGSPLQVTERIL